MKQVRICWLPSVVYNMADQDNHTCYGGWQEETREASIDIRSLCDAANKRYGPGSHWIERRDILAVRDLLSEVRPTQASQAIHTTKPPRVNAPVPERRQNAEYWRLVFG